MTAWLASLVHTIVGLAGSNPWLVAAIVFAAAFSEAIVVVGALVPGTALILALAAAAGAGGHPVWPIVTAAALGAVASDGVSFWFGHRYRSHIAERWPFTRHPELLARGDAFFDSAKFPQAKYSASKFRALGGNRYAADGTLSLHGVSKPVTLEFSWTPGAKPVLAGKATVKRLDFGVGGGDWADTELIPDAIAISTKVVFVPAK